MYKNNRKEINKKKKLIKKNKMAPGSVTSSQILFKDTE